MWGTKPGGSVGSLVQEDDEKGGIRIYIRVPLCLVDEHPIMNSGYRRRSGRHQFALAARGPILGVLTKGAGWADSRSGS
jgi:hypothetical protein